MSFCFYEMHSHLTELISECAENTFIVCINKIQIFGLFEHASPETEFRSFIVKLITRF